MKKLLIMLLALCLLFVSCDNKVKNPDGNDTHITKPNEDNTGGETTTPGGETEEPEEDIVKSPSNIPEDVNCNEGDDSVIAVAVDLFKTYRSNTPIPVKHVAETIIITGAENNPTHVSTGYIENGKQYMIHNLSIVIENIKYEVLDLKLLVLDGENFQYESGAIKVGEKTYTEEEAVTKYKELFAKIEEKRFSRVNARTTGYFKTFVNDYTILGTYIETPEFEQGDFKVSKGGNWIQFGYKESNDGNVYDEYLIVNDEFYNKATFDKVQKQATPPDENP